MSREVRMVPPDWQHPKDSKGRFVPLVDGSFEQDDAEYGAERAAWEFGFRRGYGDEPWVPREPSDGNLANVYYGRRPDPDDYMPEFPEGTATHYMIYETCSEGTPISPAFATPEELAHWLADTGASAFGGMTAPYEGWLAIARCGYAPSAVYTPATGLVSGVEAAAEVLK
jgi:hypothetical protein